MSIIEMLGTHAPWLLSGIGVAFSAFVWRVIRRRYDQRRHYSDVDQLLRRLRSSTIAIERQVALNALIGIPVRFRGKVISAERAGARIRVLLRSDESTICCEFDQRRHPRIALVKEREVLEVIGIIDKADPDRISVVPSAKPQ